MGLKGYQNWHETKEVVGEETLVVLHQGEYKLAKNDGTYFYPQAKFIAEYEHEWRMCMEYQNGEWVRPEMPQEVTDLIGDYVPNKEMIQERISRAGVIALQQIKSR